MKYAIIALLSILVLSCAPTNPKEAPSGGVNAISFELVRNHAFFLASDSLKGRSSPSPELDVAARYIAGVFESNGFQMIQGSYLNRVPLNIVSLGEKNSLSVKKEGAERSYEIKTEFTPFDMTANRTVSGSIVFAGYGITAPEFKYDDYSGIDVKGKIVFVLRHEPGEEDTTSAFNGGKATEYSNVSEKVQIAQKHGAAAVMVATDPLNHTSLTPRGFPWPSLSKFLPKDALPISLGTDEDKKIPVVHVGEEVIAQLFGGVDSLKELQRIIDKTVTPHSFEIASASAVVQTSTSIKDMSAQNVVGFLEGTDANLKKEVVVIGAHYDHVGTQKTGQPGEDLIFNGADDNASGTTAVLAIAAAFGHSPVKPKRSVLLMAFAAEERGLLGSRSYVENPLFPVDQTVAMINLDMVGRNNIDSLSVIGGSKSPDLAQIAQEENAKVGFTLVIENLSSGGSDHMSFQRKNVPYIFFFSGFHPDYHKVTDHADLLNIPKIARVATLAFRTAWRVANEDRKYKLIP
jgi:hypothetical protein